MSESETESDEEPETFTFPERALKDWKERSKLWKVGGPPCRAPVRLPDSLPPEEIRLLAAAR